MNHLLVRAFHRKGTRSLQICRTYSIFPNRNVTNLPAKSTVWDSLRELLTASHYPSGMVQRKDRADWYIFADLPAAQEDERINIEGIALSQTTEEGAENAHIAIFLRFVRDWHQ